MIFEEFFWLECGLELKRSKAKLEEGISFALTDQVLATDSILEGWLVRPFNFDMKDHWHYWIVRGKGQKETVPVRAFREWMMGEIADTNRKFAQLSGQKPPAVAGKPATA